MSLVTLTEKDRAKVEGFRAGVADAEQQAMWIEVAGIQGGEFTYSMALKPVAQAEPGDVVQREGDLALVVPARDAESLRGATVDWSDDLLRGGLTIDNPNKPQIGR